jgi:MFS family permease
VGSVDTKRTFIQPRVEMAGKKRGVAAHGHAEGEMEPASPSARIMVWGSSFGAAPQRERKEGEPPSLEDHLNHCELGWFQYKIFIMAALIVAADGMEMTVISLLRKPLMSEWGLDDNSFSLLGSTVFLGLLIGNLIGGYFADLFGRKKCIIGITVVFCIFGVISALAPDVYVFALSRFFTGIGVGSMVPVSDNHLLEWSPNVWRAKLAMTLTGVAFALGAAFACIVGIVCQMFFLDDPQWWRYMLIVCIVPGVVSLPFVW